MPTSKRTLWQLVLLVDLISINFIATSLEQTLDGRPSLRTTQFWELNPFQLCQLFFGLMTTTAPGQSKRGQTQRVWDAFSSEGALAWDVVHRPYLHVCQTRSQQERPRASVSKEACGSGT